MTSSVIHIIGLGVSASADLSREACDALAQADLVIGSERQLQTVTGYLENAKAKTLLLPSLGELAELLQQHPDKQRVVLASGDPLFYGIGAWMGRHFPLDSLRFYPAVSSLQAACHRLGWSLQDVEVVSLHGRPREKLRTRLQANKQLLLLTDAKSHPQALAQECVAAGLGHSRLFVCEALGYPQEQVRSFRAEELAQIEEAFDPLNVVAIETSKQQSVFPSFPGIDDSLFETGKESGRGLITKKEVRLAVLSLLQPGAREVIWDVGAGCGSVAVELAYWQPTAEIYAIEHHAERLNWLESNRQKFGVVGNLKRVMGRAPEVLVELPQPDKVFIGGSGGELASVLDKVWSALPQNGVLVASAVTEDTRQRLLAFTDQKVRQQQAVSDSVQIAVAREERLAGQRLYRPALPVTLVRIVKQDMM